MKPKFHGILAGWSVALKRRRPETGPLQRTAIMSSLKAPRALHAEFPSRARLVGAHQPPMTVCWRFRTSHPWTIEEFLGRDEAYKRYFYLVDRGVEVQIRPKPR